MQYLNLSRAKQAREQWNRLTPEHQLTITWALITLGAGAVFLTSIRVMPENPTLFRHFIVLYALNSLIFFLTFQHQEVIAKTLLVSLITLEIVALLYYWFNHLSISF
jgi:hypothetical protein